jgi:hypothetical protein
MSRHKTMMGGQLCTMPVPRYVSVETVCSFSHVQQGYLDIVRWLCEHGGAAASHDGTPGVDVRSKGGWTPLSKSLNDSAIFFFLTSCSIVNAASKGHLPIVLYLLSKQSADPLVRNNWGETAYDVAAAVFEIWICEVSLRLYLTSLPAQMRSRFSKKLRPRSGEVLQLHIIRYRYTQPYP